MKIFVTGGSGMVGKYIVDELLQHRHTVGILDLHRPKQKNVIFHHIDMLNLSEVVDAMKGYDAVIHSAGIPHPLNDPAKQVFNVNVNGTFNVLEAAAQNNIRKVVFTSSESTLGFAFMTNNMAPDYLPIDEHHPLRSQDPYGLSKIIGEEICRSYSAKYGMRTICLREPWIWVPEEDQIAFYQQLVREYKDWHKNMWAYVHVYDVAKAHRLALEKDLPNLHEKFFITANENWTGRPSLELIQKYYPEIDPDRCNINGASTFISHEKARVMLGYTPEYSVHDLLPAQ